MFKNFINSTYIALLNHPIGAIFYLCFWFLAGFSFNIIDFLLLTLFIIACETFTKTSLNLKQAYKNLNNLWIILLTTIFYIFIYLIFKENHSLSNNITLLNFYISLIIALMAFICARKFQDFNTFEHFLAALFFSISFWVIFGIFIGIFFISFSFLFNLSYDIPYVLNFWIFSAGCFSLFLLGDFKSYNFKKIFIFMLNVFSVLYIILLLCYAFGVFLNFVEKLSIVHLCLWFGNVLLCTLWINLSFYKIKKIILNAFFITLLCLTTFVFYAVIVRIIEYGFTPTRLAVLGANLWLLIASYLSTFHQNKTLRLSFYILMIISLFLGIFATKISIYSQQYQLQKLENIISQNKSHLNYKTSMGYYYQIKNIHNTLNELDLNHNSPYDNLKDFLTKHDLNQTKILTSEPDFFIQKDFTIDHIKLNEAYNEVLFNFSNKNKNDKYSMDFKDNILYFYDQDKTILQISNFNQTLKVYNANLPLTYKLDNSLIVTFLPLEFIINKEGKLIYFKAHIFIKNTK
ncbi:DUF4153 domain-containing protein [Campylobacter volucris]|uniref:DUF4153 domain-containing protein n=1 Tax=Campylobacter volucris TaxID=1031542 RepID=UPI00189CD7EE|nr:DUF4153 domain-containing protein [Campylobacter volucris]MBF7048409.1 DUF4153 domain-containing protein [Campylobacter volucris]MBF7060177.1 DUF4153 domain-containing protein [Campylobacter volucris]